MNESGFKGREDMQSRRWWNNKSIQITIDCKQCKQIDVSSKTKWCKNFQKLSH